MATLSFSEYLKQINKPLDWGGTLSNIKNSFTPSTRTLPNGGGTYMTPVPVGGGYGQTPTPAPTPVVAPAPIIRAQPPTPIFANSQPVAPIVSAPATAQMPKEYINPATGQLYTDEEYVNNVASSLPRSSVKTSGDVGTYAGNALTNPNATNLSAQATNLNNARNDIATGTTDPYDITKGGTIVYSPTERAAIEKAYAGIYDPALNDVFARLKTKKEEDTAALAQKNKLAEMAQQHAYDLELKKTPAGTAVSSSGTYVPGENPSVDAFSELIWNGKATMANVPKEYKMAVATAMQSYGNQINGKPTTTEIGKQKLSAAKKLLTMFDKGEGISTVGKSRMFGGGIATPGSKSADFYSLGDQLMAIAQLDASKFLKGQGQVSDAERAILANAATSLKYGQSEELFRKTLVDMINVLEGNVPTDSTSSGTTQPETMVLNGQTLYLQEDGTYE